LNLILPCAQRLNTEALLLNLRLITFFNLPLAIIAGWLVWHSLSWPLVGDATFFHFAANQMRMGAVPYRDIFDVNMPLIFAIHPAVVEIGGMGDLAWRVFDLTALAVLSAFILIMVWPAGRAVAILAALIMLVMHLLLGPYSAGQRDFLMLIPVMAAAVASTRAAEDPDYREFHLFLAGVAAMVAASLKPTALLLLFLPAFVFRLRWRDFMCITAGACLVGFLVLGALAAWSDVGPFVIMLRQLLPSYALAGTAVSTNVIRWLAPVAGLAIAAALSISGPKPVRVRVMIGLTIFGLIHLLAQLKGYFYHFYLLALGLACWGAWSVASLAFWRCCACLLVIALSLAWQVPKAVTRTLTYPSLEAASAMQTALESRLPRGARVQVLDSDYGAFLAMARAGMRQATAHALWFTLIAGEDSIRRDFIATLEADLPAAILLTNYQSPLEPGFEVWPDFKTLLASHYVLDASGDLAGPEAGSVIFWRLYLRRADTPWDH